MYAFETGEIINDELWYFSMTSNALICVNIHSGDLMFMGSVPGEKLYGYRLYGSMQIVKEQIILVPLSATSIAVFSMKLKKFEHIIPIKLPEENGFSYDENHKFHSSVKFENRIYMFGMSYPEILMYDTCKQQVQYSNKWIDIYRKKYEVDICKDQEHFIFGKYNCIIKNKLYIPLGFTNIIMIMDLNSEFITFQKIGLEGEIYHSITYFNKRIWLACKEGICSLVSYNPYSKEQIKYTYDFLGEIYKPCELITLGDKMLIIPVKNIVPQIMDKNEKIQISRLSEKKSWIFYYRVYEEGLILYSNYDRKISIFNKSLELVREIDDDKILKNVIIDGIKTAQDKMGCFIENSVVGAEEFIESIVRNNGKGFCNEKKDGGNKIFETLNA